MKNVQFVQAVVVRVRNLSAVRVEVGVNVGLKDMLAAGRTVDMYEHLLCTLEI